MTLFLTDVSRHQVERPDALDLAKAKAAGMNGVNIQLDRGRQDDVLPGWAHEYAEGARSLGMPVSTYRWLDSRLPGAESARRAFERMHLLGGPAGMAHSVDCEADASEQTLRDYVRTMTGLLGRPIAIYSGAWWMRPRGWQVADLSPFLWSAPAAGYLGEYPGDDSPHWMVAYAGWQHLSAMQYAVQPLPDTGDCSLSAIRDPAVWAALTGDAMPTYQQLQAESWWNREIYTDAMKWLAGALTKFFGTPPVNAGSKGDNKHLNGGHRSQEWIVNSRYCTNRTYTVEQGLTGEQARYLSALDYTPATRDVMLAISQRIDRATRAGQLEEVVEWFGNTDGDQQVDGWNNIRNAVISSDSSHLWHLHLRVARRYANDMAVARRIFTVLTGTPHSGGSNVLSLINHVGDIYVADGMLLRGVANGAQYANIQKAAKAGFTGPWANVVEGIPRDIQVDDPDDLAAYGQLPSAAAAVELPGGEQLAEVVASAIDSRIPSIVDAVNDAAAKRLAE